LLCFFSILSCSHYNEYGRKRVNFNLERIKPNSDPKAFTIIDTTKLYKKVAMVTPENIRPEFAKVRLEYLKFYNNGRVGKFDSIDFDIIESFNPKNAESYLYQYKNNELVVQIYFTHVQCGQCFIKERLKKVSNDTIQLLSDGYIDTYVAVDIPKSF